MIDTITLQFHPKPKFSNQSEHSDKNENEHEHEHEHEHDVMNEIAVERPPPEISSHAFSGVYQLISSPSTSASIAECKKITEFIITTIYRDVILFSYSINYRMRSVWKKLSISPIS